MQNLNLQRGRHNSAQLFFLERLIELLNRYTIDTYRSKAVNTHTIIYEVIRLLKDRLNGRLPNSKAIHYALDEAKLLIEKDNYLDYSPFSKKKILSVIGELHKKQASEDLEHSIVVLSNFADKINKNHLSCLYEKLLKKIQEYDEKGSFTENFDYFNKLNRLSSEFVTELLNKGFSKRFLYRFLISKTKTKSFENFMEILEGLTKMEAQEYMVIFKVEIPQKIFSNIKFLKENIQIKDNFTDILDEKLFIENQHFKGFINQQMRNTKFLNIKVKSLDEFSALDEARKIVSENFDIIHLGYSSDKIFPLEKVFIYSKNRNGKIFYSVRVYNYELDGNFKDGNYLYERMFESIFSVLSANDVKNDSKQKLKSAIRYLRMGNESVELEHKFINYWIAIEYLFADISINNNKTQIGNIKTIFPKIHSNIYLKRLLKDFHDNIKRLKLSDKITSFNEDYIKCFSSENIFNEIIQKFQSKYPLLAYRANYLKSILFSTKKEEKESTEIGKLVRSHKKNMELHISRIYGIRNLIVHNAVLGSNIISITANLKYYLTFLIITIVLSLEKNENLNSIEDIFILENSIYDSLSNEGFPVEKLLKIDSYFDILA